MISKDGSNIINDTNNDTESEIINKTIQIITDDFELQYDKSIIYSDINILKEALALKIKELLHNNIERLMSILYRIDVPQENVDIVFDSNLKEDIQVKLADVIINRQLEKIKTRHYYKNNKGE